MECCMLLSLLLLSVSLFLIALLSERVIGYVSALSEALGLSEMAAGFILLSIATSLPELSVSVIASAVGEGALSVGNVLGSNVANLTVIMGLGVLLSKTNILIKGESQRELIQFLFLSSIIPLFIVQRGSLSPILGVVLLVLFAYFAITISRKTEKRPTAEPIRKGATAIIGLKFIGSVCAIILLSKLVVDNAIEIADLMNLPHSILGATVIGLGTSLPELATTIQALKKGLHSMALGNLLGSCITNITLILGASSLISFSTVNVVAVESIMFYVLLSSMSLWYLVGSRERIGRNAAILLCSIYAAFVLQQVGISIFII
jgi:cation:H+ antiporter